MQTKEREESHFDKVGECLYGYQPWGGYYVRQVTLGDGAISHVETAADFLAAYF